MSTDLKASISLFNGNYVLEFDQCEAERRYILKNVAFFHGDILIKNNCFNGIAAFATERKPYKLDVAGSEIAAADHAIIYLENFDSGKCFELSLARDEQGWATLG